MLAEMELFKTGRCQIQHVETNYFHAVPNLKLYINFSENVAIICPRVFPMNSLSMCNTNS